MERKIHPWLRNPGPQSAPWYLPLIRSYCYFKHRRVLYLFWYVNLLITRRPGLISKLSDCKLSRILMVAWYLHDFNLPAVTMITNSWHHSTSYHLIYYLCIKGNNWLAHYSWSEVSSARVLYLLVIPSFNQPLRAPVPIQIRIPSPSISAARSQDVLQCGYSVGSVSLVRFYPQPYTQPCSRHTRPYPGLTS